MASPKRKDGVIVTKRKQAARQMRSSVDPLRNQDGSISTHRMEWGTGSGRYKHQVNPTIFPKKAPKSMSKTQKTKWVDMADLGKEGKERSKFAAYKEAMSRGEVIGFKSKRRAANFAGGSWKPKRNG